MIILDATTKSLQFKLGGTVATSQLPFAASYVDATSTATTPGEQDGVSNNTTAVTVVGSPAASTQRLIKSLVIQNADTAAATVIIIYNNNSTSRNIIIATLAIGDQLIYEDGNGWSAVDKNGNLKTSGGSGAGAVSSVSNSDGTLTISPTTGNVVASLNQAGLQSYLPGGFVNKFRNPQMIVSQRGNSGTISTAGAAYTLDGFIASATGANATWAQNGTVLSTPWSGGSIELLGATSNTDVSLKQRIESTIAAPLANQVVTFQAYVNNNTGATLTPKLTVKHAGSADNWSAPVTDVSAVSLQSIPNGTAATVAYTFAASSSSYFGLEVTLDFGAIGNGSYVITTNWDIRATPGVTTGLNSAPPIAENRPIAVELAFCQRYLPAFGSVTGPIGSGAATSTSGSGFYIPFQVPTFIAPTGLSITTPGDLEIANLAGTDIAALTGLTFSKAGPNGAFCTAAVSGTPLTSGTSYLLYTKTALGGNLVFTGAEL